VTFDAPEPARQHAGARAASAGKVYHDFTDETDIRRRIGAMLERVRRGGDA
jgi:hypothetical protein